MLPYVLATAVTDTRSTPQRDPCREALHVLLELKNIKRRIEAGRANEAEKGYYEATKESAWLGAAIAFSSPHEGVLRQEAAQVGPRFFMDHGMIHDRVSGQHIHTDPEIEPGATERLFALLNELSTSVVQSENAASTDVERLKEALRQVKAWVVGERIPNWDNDTTTYLTRGKIADICDFAIAHPDHPRDVHLTVEKR